MKEKKPTPQPLCPFCSCSFKEKELIVEMKMVYKFDNDGRVFIRQKAFDKIICSNCLNDITMSFIATLYEQNGVNSYEEGFKDGYKDAVIDAQNNGEFTKF